MTVYIRKCYFYGSKITVKHRTNKGQWQSELSKLLFEIGDFQGEHGKIPSNAKVSPADNSLNFAVQFSVMNEIIHAMTP
ncbi:hypothetical protein [Shewanella sp.]|uniref:hypothetical protein n=1 Tax=Shewanella sp. TaxID=50422 RepID=UPI003F36F19D